MRTVAFVSGLTLGGCALLAAQDRGDFKWTGSLGPGKTLEVIGVNGDIEARGAGGREARVEAVKTARRSDVDDVEIKVVEHDRGVTICALYPSPRRSRPNECLPGGRGRNETRDNDVHVDFTVVVPSGVEFVGRTVNGDVDALDLTEEAEAYSVNGSITLETAGYGSASTVNGSIRARLGRADWDGELAFETVNGEIELSLPASLSTEVRASSVNGGITTDFPLTVPGKFGHRSMRGTIGNGGRELSLTTVNGGMELRRGR